MDAKFKKYSQFRQAEASLINAKTIYDDACKIYDEAKQNFNKTLGSFTKSQRDSLTTEYTSSLIALTDADFIHSRPLVMANSEDEDEELIPAKAANLSKFSLQGVLPLVNH
jgi:hypothetical protein